MNIVIAIIALGVISFINCRKLQQLTQLDDANLLEMVVLVAMMMACVVYILVNVDYGGLYSKDSDWIGFWGGIIGSLLSGVIAIYVLKETTKQTRKIQEDAHKESEQRERLAMMPIVVFAKRDMSVSQGFKVTNEEIYKSSCSTNKVGQYGISAGRIANIGEGHAKDIEVIYRDEQGNYLNMIRDIPTPKIGFLQKGCSEPIVDSTVYGIPEQVIIKYYDMQNYLYTTFYEVTIEDNGTSGIVGMYRDMKLTTTNIQKQTSSEVYGGKG